MTKQQQLPFELLEHIVSFLSSDLLALSNVSLSCHVLDVIAKPLLFTVLDFRRLGNSDMAPFRHFAKELHVTWHMDMFNEMEAELLDHLLLPHLSPDVIPRLQRFVVRGIGARGMEYLSIHAEALTAFSALTSLTLQETHHPRFCDVQTLICALPHLKTLHAHTVSWTKGSGNEGESTAEVFLQRPRLETLHVSPTFPEKTLTLLRWLAQTPSQESLKVFDIPYPANQAAALVPLFGPSVQTLVTPVRMLQASSVERYTALASLTLLMHKYHPKAAHWVALPAVLSSLPSPALLRTLTIQLELKRMRSEDELVPAVVQAEMLEQTDGILFPNPQDSLERAQEVPRRPFVMLEEVQFVVKTSLKLSEARSAVFAGMVRGFMSRTDAHGKLRVVFEA
ncbi:hypothetical protein C8Q74DRAFT_1192074 [Fomes fomentarius]|nr:hypothetical protein C8Q74DRAFT_1192074 [Fomes fomentarius]